MMIDYEIETNDTDYVTDNSCGDYCTNPITQPENVHKTSWLDDLGWI